MRLPPRSAVLTMVALCAAVAVPAFAPAAEPASASPTSESAADAAAGDSTAPIGAAPPTTAVGSTPAPLPNAAPYATALAERDAAYVAFRREFQAGRYTEALPYAERVVALTEEHATDPAQLPSALNNLGATHYKLGDYVAAEQAYAKALRLVEEQQGAASRRLLTPLRGLALTYQSGGRKDAAAPLLERAVAISRRSDGLFNPDQLELIEPLIDSYVATGRWQDADQLHQYAYRLNERRYGAGSPRLVPSLQRLAGWYEQTGRYTQARRTWARAYSNSTTRGQENVNGAVNALRGMARTYRLEYTFGPEPMEENDPAAMGQMGVQFDGGDRDPWGRRIPSGLNTSDYRLDPQGREFLEAALKMVRQTTPPSPLAEAQLLVELGDWIAVAERESKSLPLYEQAWSLLPKQDPGVAEAPRNPLLYPTPLLYRPPPSARRLRDRPADTVAERVAIAEFTVDEDGKVRDARIVEGDANDNQRSAFLASIGRAIYRPRFVDGKPVPTENVRYRETFRELKRAPETAPPKEAG
jgi:tetratricopeptide (TPR) repeat protein